MRVGHHTPSETSLGNVNRFATLQQLLGDNDSAPVFFAVVKVFGRTGQHDRHFRMFRESRGELQGSGLCLLMPSGTFIGRKPRLFTVEGHDPRISRIGGTRIARIFIGHQTVFLGRLRQLPAFNERISQQVARLCRIGIGGKLLQQLPIPVRRLEEIGLLLLALCKRVVVLGEVPQVRLEVPHHGRLPFQRPSVPVGLPEAIPRHELALGIHDKLQEAALGIGGQRLQQQQRRRIAVRGTLHVSTIGVGSVRVALLGEVQISQLRIQQMGVNRAATCRQRRIDTLRSLEVAEVETQRPEGIFDEFAFRTRHLLQVTQATTVGRVYQLAVQQHEERADAGFILGLLEEGPTLLVERLLMKRPGRPAVDDGLVSRLRIHPALGHEQGLGTTEPSFVHQSTLGVFRDQPRQHGSRFVRLTIGIQGACQLIKHGVVARVARVSFQQAAVEQDGIAGLQRRPLCQILLDASELSVRQLQVREAPHGFSAQRFVAALQLQKLFVGHFGLGGIRLHGHVPTHFHLA